MEIRVAIGKAEIRTVSVHNVGRVTIPINSIPICIVRKDAGISG
jgi:hypothetical protein